jgi:membrane-associated phospholipid phosphatase
MYWRNYIIYTTLFCAVSMIGLSQDENKPFPYSLSQRDKVLLPVGIGMFVTGHYLGEEKDYNLSMNDIAKLNRNSINRFDRNATYHWNKSADRMSDIILRVVPPASLTIMAPHVFKKEWRQVATLGVMFLEVHFFTKGITDITKSLAGRTRPYLYNTSFTVEERFTLQDESPVASTSFISGHTSSVFATAVMVSKLYTDIYGKGVWSTVIWSSSLTLASLTAYGRVAGGEHFPTDVIGGAIVGSAIGYLIPMLHKQKNSRVTLSVLPSQFYLSYQL